MLRHGASAGVGVHRRGLGDGELARLDGLQLLAGMPVEVFIQTTPRTVASFLVKPLTDQLARAFRGR